MKIKGMWSLMEVFRMTKLLSILSRKSRINSSKGRKIFKVIYTLENMEGSWEEDIFSLDSSSLRTSSGDA